jgi:hypothetical protein
MANVASEVGRAIKWRNKGNSEYSRMAFERALELLDFTIRDARKGRLRELTRLREVMVDYFAFDNVYGSSDRNWHNYFYGFNYAVAKRRKL